MLQTYFKTALRNFKKHKVHSVINLIGLCLGLTCALFIFVYVHHQLSYDKLFNQADQIYRLERRTTLSNQSKTVLWAVLDGPYNPGPLNSISGVIGETRFAAQLNPIVRANGKKISESNFWAADSSFFNIFNFPVISGDPKGALNHSNSVVLSKKLAQKYFNSQHAVGQTMTLAFEQKKVPVTIRGVINVPVTTHLQFNAVVSKNVYKDLYGISLSKRRGYTYIKLRKGQNPLKIAKEITADNKKLHSTTYHLEPITRIHLYSHARHELGTNSHVRYIYFLSVIAFILLIVAGINFTSLATAQNLQRYKEAGIRKVLGAYKAQLMGQFLAETAGISLVALIIGYIIVHLTLPLFNNFAGASLQFSEFLTPLTLIVFIGGAIVLGIVAGLYPALLLSSFQPTHTLKGPGSSGKKGTSLWKSIVVVQFAVSIAMIICTLTISRQMHYIQHKDLGFNKSHIITFPNFIGRTRYKAFESRIKKLKGVKNITVSTYTTGTSKASSITLAFRTGGTDTSTVHWISTDYNYLATYGIKLKKGRFFSPKHPTDTTQAVVLNEAAVRALHLKSPLGKHIQVAGFGGSRKIIGVTQNFNFLSLYQKIPPVAFIMFNRAFFNFSVKLAPNHPPSATIAQIKRVWQNMIPNVPFQYKFINQQFNNLYKTDRMMGKVFGLFAILALFISCLGLFSLSSFMAARKTKEIGIRKVLGASVSNILFSFYKRYGMLVGMACLIAIPASYIFLSRWLQNYAYRIGMPAWVFFIAVAVTLFIAFSAVSFESVKAALANPVDSLKQE
jgi:putative ABC transport system permease protein